jgi:hypothetical protein
MAIEVPETVGGEAGRQRFEPTKITRYKVSAQPLVEGSLALTAFLYF